MNLGFMVISTIRIPTLIQIRDLGEPEVVLSARLAWPHDTPVHFGQIRFIKGFLTRRGSVVAEGAAGLGSGHLLQPCLKLLFDSLKHKRMG